MSDAPLFRLYGAVQKYPWGRDGSDSLVGRMGKTAAGPDFEFESKTPYAELWQGTHPNGPARLADDPNTTLSAHLSKHKDYLGAAQRFEVVVKEPTDVHVPFLFKVLTCKQALPLQIHPDKELSAKLHEEDPEQFKDEIAVALEPFKGFAGFRPLDRIVDSVKAVPEMLELLEGRSELKSLWQSLASDPSPDTLRALFGALLKLPSDATASTVSKLIKRVKADGAKALKAAPDASTLALVLSKLESEYGSDPAVLVASFFMNLLELQPGEGAYVPADEAHAWLEGTIIELMATSDNVLNIGFMEDGEKNSVDLVTKVLTCTPRDAEKYRLKTGACDKASSDRTTQFKVPFEEFSLLHCKPAGVYEELGPFAGPLVAIVTSDAEGVLEHVGGSDADIKIDAKLGTIVFLAAGNKMRVGPGLDLWAAFYDE